MKQRPYQTEALAHLPLEGRYVIELPTGTGKTPVACWLAQGRGGRTLYLAHRDELIRQAVDKFGICWPQARVGVVKADENDHWQKDVVVASVQTVSRRDRLGDLPQDWTTCIVDEAHHAFAPSYRLVMDYAAAPLTVGFTATAFRTSGRESLLDAFPGGVVYRKTLLQMIAAGYLCDIRAKRVDLGVDLDEVGMRAGDFDDADLGRVLQTEAAVEAVVEAYHREAKGRKALVFGCTVEHVTRLLGAFHRSNIHGAMISGDTALDERRGTLRDFGLGQVQVLVNCAVLLEGYDEPSIDCVIVARPTLSRLLYTQMIGRGTRKHPGKEDCLVLDCVGASGRHDLETLADLFGITELSAEKGIQELIDGTQKEQAELAAAGVSVEDLDLFKQSSLHWIKDGTRFLLGVGQSTLALQPNGVTWDIREIPRSKAMLAKKLYAGLTLEYAQGTAEDLVRHWNVGALANAGMNWRHDEPSIGQLELLRKLGLGGNPKNKGEAADWITRKFAQGR